MSRVRTWTNEVLEKAQPLADTYITIWQTTEELRDFFERERQELGVLTGEETEFLATHEAWRGYPRIHICEERLKGIPEAVIQGAIHHEIGHALHHCSPEFYTFVFSKDLQETARSSGLEFNFLQQCVYFVSIAIKDREVVEWLAKIGLGSCQLSLLHYLITDVEEERQTWDLVHQSPALKKIVVAAFLKTLIPIEALISVGIEGAQVLRSRWHEAYGWLHESERERLLQFARSILEPEGETFQRRLEGATFRLIAEPFP